MPTGLVITLAIATPLLAFLGSLLGHWLSRRASRELNTWRRREETMRLLRWASELAVQDKTADLGVNVLVSLGESELLQPDDQPLVDAVLATVAGPPDDAYTEEAAKGSIDEHDNDI